MKKGLTLSLVTLSIFVFGCTKAYQKDWLVADITVKNAVTGQPVKAYFILRWHESILFSQGEDEEIILGGTDENGNLKVQKEISRKNPVFSLDVYPQVKYYVEPVAQGFPAQTVKLYGRGKNEITINLDPYYAFILNAKNVNCMGVSDTAWITVNGHVDTLIGCADEEVKGRYGGSSAYHEITDCISTSNLIVQIRTKKSGIENSYTQNFTLIPAGKKILQLNY